MKYVTIAIDGPSGAGKTTVAKRIAAELGYIYVDTGAMYRAIGLFVDRQGVQPTDRSAVCALLPSIALNIEYVDGAQHIFLDNEDVTDSIRSDKASRYASDVSAIPEVREFLVEFQRSFAKSNNIVMDGRDIGTVILPKADLKIYLTADPEVRAMRRYKEQIAKGEQVTYVQVRDSLVQRDKNDMERATAPLVAASDSIIVDTTECDFEQSIVIMKKLIKESGCV